MNRHRVGYRAPLALLVSLALVTGCAKLRPPQARAGDAPYDVINRAELGSIGGRQITPLPHSAYKPRWFFLARLDPPRFLHKPAKMDSTLDDWVRHRNSTDRETLFVSFVDTVQVPRFPRFDMRENRGTRRNREADSTARTMVADLESRRSAQFVADTANFAARYNGSVVATYWLLQGALVVVPLSSVDSLAHRPDVVFIRPNRGQGPPQALKRDQYSPNDVICGRATIGSDPYRNLGAGWLALLDTGVETAVPLLCDAVDRFCMVANCVTGDCPDADTTICSIFTSCLTGAAGDVDPDGHGTSTAALLTGSDGIVSGRYGGLMKTALDCFTIYGSDNKVRADAIVDAFQLAVRRGNAVIASETQEQGTAMADVEAAAEHAFDSGVAVIAANGNDHAYGTGEPARGRKVIGVGAYDLGTGKWWDQQAFGATDDGRFKPDLIAPSNTETASHLATALHSFGGTSCATPYVAGAASLLRFWMAPNPTDPFDPGEVYAQLIAAGDALGPYSSSTKTGAGRMRLNAPGTGLWGKTWVSSDLREVDIPIEVGAEVVRIDAAIWWPETTYVDSDGAPVDTHDDVNLSIVSPGWLGSAQATSNSEDGVFERAQVTSTTPLHQGTWQLCITPHRVRKTPQTVYWAVTLLKAIPPPAACPPDPTLQP